MDRHVRGIGHQCTASVENGTGEIEPFLDVDRIGGVLQRDAHLLGDRHEQVVENLQHNRIGISGTDGVLAHFRLETPHDDVVSRRDLGAPAGLDNDRLVGFDDQRRSVDLLTGRQMFAQIDAGVVPVTATKHRARFVGNAGIGCLR